MIRGRRRPCATQGAHFPQQRTHSGKRLRLSKQRSIGRGIVSDDHRVCALGRRVNSLELLGGIALLAVKPEIRPPLLPLDRSDAEDRPSTARRAAQAARAGLEMGGWQLPHPVVNLDDPSDFPSHQVVLRHGARVVAARERAYSTVLLSARVRDVTGGDREA